MISCYDRCALFAAAAVLPTINRFHCCFPRFYAIYHYLLLYNTGRYRYAIITLRFIDIIAAPLRH